MTPAFSSWSAFFAMGGYAFYVWLAVSCTLILLGGLCLHTFTRHRRLLQDIRQQRAREQRISAARAKKIAAQRAGVSQ